jgi:hypothetical protein
VRRSARSGIDDRMPNLFTIGVPKAATTLLHEALDRAPSVYMSRVKEPGYFTTSSDRSRGLDYYLDAYFAHAAGNAIRGESTPWYFYSDEARERIAELPRAESIRLLVMLRRPSGRAQSMYFDQVRLNREPRTFEDAVEEELAGLERGELGDDVRQRYVWCGLYADHLKRWYDTFGPERVHVAFFEDVMHRPGELWKELGLFLEHDLGPEHFDEVRERDRNRAGTLRWPRLDAYLRSMEGSENRAIRAAKGLLPPGLHRRALQRLGRLNRTSTLPLPEVDHAHVLARLDAFYANDLARLSASIEGIPADWFTETP